MLPQDEWVRLSEEQIPDATAYVRPEHVDVVVVEEDAGKIVASMTVMRVLHYECVWVGTPNAGIVRSLLTKAASLAQKWGEEWAFGGAENARMGRVLTRLGGIPMDYVPFVIPTHPILRGRHVEPGHVRLVS